MSMFGKRHLMLEPGAAAPSFELQDVQGGAVSLRAMLDEGALVLFFFKISCPVCQMTAPFMERLSLGSAVRVIGISQDDAPSTRAFNSKYGVTFPVLLDPGKTGYQVSNAYGIHSVPSTFVIETDGQISRAFPGFSKPDLEELGRRMSVAPFLPAEKVPAFRAG